MAKVNGKQKGNTFERWVANFLSDTFGEKFYRTAHSGAYTGKSNFYRRESMSEGTQKAFVGDIIAPDGYNVVVECKSYKEIPGGIKGLLDGKSTGLDEWLSEVTFDSGIENPHLVFFKLNYMGTFVVVPQEIFKIKLDLTPHIIYIFKEKKYVVLSVNYFDRVKDEVRGVVQNGEKSK